MFWFCSGAFMFFCYTRSRFFCCATKNRAHYVRVKCYFKGIANNICLVNLSYRVSQQILKFSSWVFYKLSHVWSEIFRKIPTRKKNCIADLRLAFSQGMQNMMRHFTFQEPPDLVTGNTFFRWKCAFLTFDYKWGEHMTLYILKTFDVWP